MKKSNTILVMVLVLLIAWWIIYSRYNAEPEVINNIQVQNTDTANTGHTAEDDDSIILTYQWEWIKDASNSFFDDMTKWENIVTWLTVPWDIAFRPDGKIYITERIWNILLYDPATKKTSVWSKIAVSQREGAEKWLLGIAADSRHNDIVYVAYTYQNGNSYVNTLAKIDKGDGTEKITKLIDGVVADDNHDWWRVLIWPDGKIYRTMWDAEITSTAQNKDSLNGKILRVNTDGSVPSDNPIKGSYVWSEWHRNPQWLAWQPKTNYLRSSEHGPSQLGDCCKDELNIILPWKNYWRPVIRWEQQKENLQQPVWQSSESDTWAPGWMTFITQGARANSLLVAWLKWESIYRVLFDNTNPTKILSVERHIYKAFWRLRGVVEHEWYIYVLTSNKDWRQKGTIRAEDDRILRIKIQ